MTEEPCDPKIPSKADLAGINITCEGEEDLTVRPANWGAGENLPKVDGPPSKEDLAGITITCEGNERTIRDDLPIPRSKWEELRETP